MATYVIGDVQGCFDALKELLTKIDFDPDRDRLWFTGDLVNRGQQSAEVVRFAIRTESVSVLGNHDLHLLAIACDREQLKRHDTLTDILEAPDRQVLLDWLRYRPLLHHDTDLDYTLIHAGLLPQWDLPMAQNLANEIETLLQDPSYENIFEHMYGDMPDHWSDNLSGWNRARVIVNVFTRLRYCDVHGHIDLTCKGPPGTQPRHLLPWFQIPDRKNRTQRIIFGHWSTLDVWNDNGVIGLDSGCLWGRSLTAVRIDRSPVTFFSVPCPQQQAPH